MIINKVLASYTFRFMSIYVACLSVASLVVLTLVYATISYDYFAELSDSITNELKELRAVYEQGGAAEVDTLVDEKIRKEYRSRFFYLVVDKDYKKIAGNLDEWPEFKQYGEGWLSFQLDILAWDGEAIDVGFVARTEQLDNGSQVLVARHYDDIIYYANLVGGALVRSMVVTIVLGAIGGAILAGINVKQLDTVNKTLQRIMSGDLSERIGTNNQRGEMRELIFSINRMLDRIQTLMAGVRQVSDNIAHDLRTPLTRLRNHLTQLHGQIDHENEETVQHLIEEADSLLSTFNALLRIARVESGSRREGFAMLDLKVIMLDVVELYEPLALDKAITMTESLADGMQLHGDRDLLFQACANLIDNAIKYTPEQGNIHIQLEHIEDQDSLGCALISVADSGAGIPGKDKAKVFRRFFRVETSRSEQPGNGLGLSLVSAVVKLHDGDISLFDNDPGLRVEMTLPLSRA
ncbi:HAMP domain-containing sensor histidine kinase [Oceanicoccus sp. KOV_DT_Chl]|uniref:sensor histidine kinase n=1 Tax=Oceanicoccus sp. KOV_DT_Chl TaxID=1904639 RepID=UPI000C7BC456|nr:HAMP domain-containing sensor histidine kinase [Oceanicoccus sp. KOV_DT_Chl]